MEMLQYAILIFISLIILISYFVYHRSFSATIIEMIVNFIQIKKLSNNKKIYNQYIKLKNKEEEINFVLPKFVCSSKIEEEKVNDYQVFNISKNKNYKTIILYLHGGSYIQQPLIFHWTFCDKLAKDLNAKVIVPIYPLAPKHNWKEAYSLIEEIYANVLKEKNKKVIIMGDSAGGGMALGFCKYLSKKKMKQPSKLILISPWLDITMSNDKIKNFDSKDPFLSVYALKKAGELWAGNLKTSNYKLSPKNGSLKDIKNVYLFVGTREIFYPDILEFFQKLKKKKIKSQLFVGEGLNHVYPLHPIPEAKKAYKEILKIID